jgi:hypothetical protein
MICFGEGREEGSHLYIELMDVLEEALDSIVVPHLVQEQQSTLEGGWGVSALALACCAMSAFEGSPHLAGSDIGRDVPVVKFVHHL